MAHVNVTCITVLQNPAPFKAPLQFEVTFECIEELDDDLEWKIIYVSSAENSSLDQTLDEILVGPVPVGVNKFVLEVEAPDVTVIPEKDILGVTVILVTVSYREKEFIRVGYYVNNEYTEEYDPEVGPPKPLDMDKVVRTILAEKPRVTKFPIPWGDVNPENVDKEQDPQESTPDANMENEDEVSRQGLDSFITSE